MMAVVMIFLFFLLILLVWYLLTRRIPRESNYVPSIVTVVARYNENISWLSESPFNRYPILLYEKGKSRFEGCCLPICRRVLLPNVGRCDHTYLHYIISHYNNLPDRIIFLPGSIQLNHKIEAARHMFDIIENDKKLSEYFHSSGDDAKQELYNFTIDSWSSTDKDNLIENNESDLLKSRIRPFGKWFEYHFSHQKKIKKIWLWGIFATTRDRIRAHPRALYKRLIQDLEIHSNPEVGHYMERTWASLFIDP